MGASYSVGGHIKQCSYFGKLVNLKRLPSGPAIPILVIYPREMKSSIYTKMCTPMFIAALSIIAKRWENSKHPSIGEWINKIWCTRSAN